MEERKRGVTVSVTSELPSFGGVGGGRDEVSIEIENFRHFPFLISNF